jgi:hypothetical protein
MVLMLSGVVGVPWEKTQTAEHCKTPKIPILFHQFMLKANSFFHFKKIFLDYPKIQSTRLYFIF